VSAPQTIPLIVSPAAPEVRLLDAAAAGIDEPELRAWARTQAAVVGASYASRSYCYPYALVAWHTEPVGVDIERIEPFDHAFANSICTPSKRRMLSYESRPDGFLTSLWSSKKALAKALGDARRYDPRRLDSPVFWPEGRAGPWRAVLLPVPASHSAWLCWRSSATGV
jgi:hypothetical protein